MQQEKQQSLCGWSSTQSAREQDIGRVARVAAARKLLLITTKQELWGNSQATRESEWPIYARAETPAAIMDTDTSSPGTRKLFGVLRAVDQFNTASEPGSTWFASSDTISLGGSPSMHARSFGSER